MGSLAQGILMPGSSRFSGNLGTRGSPRHPLASLQSPERLPTASSHPGGRCQSCWEADPKRMPAYWFLGLAPKTARFTWSVMGPGHPYWAAKMKNSWFVVKKTGSSLNTQTERTEWVFFVRVHRSVLSDSLDPKGFSRQECWSGLPFQP